MTMSQTYAPGWRELINNKETSRRAVSPRTWIKQTDYPQLEFARSLRSFTSRRASLLAVLEPLPPEGWSRSATVIAVGRVYERTVLDYAERLARHERDHVRQIGDIVNTMHQS